MGSPETNSIYHILCLDTKNIFVVSKDELQVQQKKLLMPKCLNKNMADEVHYRLVSREALREKATQTLQDKFLSSY